MHYRYRRVTLDKFNGNRLIRLQRQSIRSKRIIFHALLLWYILKNISIHIDYHLPLILHPKPFDLSSCSVYLSALHTAAILFLALASAPVRTIMHAIIYTCMYLNILQWARNYKIGFKYLFGTLNCMDSKMGMGLHCNGTSVLVALVFPALIVNWWFSRSEQLLVHGTVHTLWDTH